MKTHSWAGIALSLSLAIATSGCSSSKDAEPVDLQSGARTHVFDPKQVRELELSVWDPSTVTRWSASLQRSAEPQGGDAPIDGAWKIVSASVDVPLRDRRAHSQFVNHLLDTLSTLTVAGKATAAPLSRYGLEIPLAALRWRVGGEQHSIEIGAVSGAASHGYTRFARLRAGMDAPVYEVRGAFLQMLDHLSSFERLRQTRLATFTADDIDQIEVRKAGKPVFYAQRAALDWEDRKNRKLKRSAAVAQALESWTHLQIQDFLDAEESQAAAARTLESQAKRGLELRLTHREGRTETFRIAQNGRQVLGSLSARDAAVFALYPKALTVLSEFR